MAPKRNTPRLSVHFPNTSTTTSINKAATTLPLFLTASGVSGTVDTTLLDTAFDSLNIKLDGTISIRVPQKPRPIQYGVDDATPYRRLNKRTIALAQILAVGSATGKTSFPFRLDIVNGDNPHDRLRGSPRVVPPTLYHKKVASSPMSTQAETTEVTVSYTLSISAMINNTTVDTISLPVRIYDNSHVQPPAYQGPAIVDYAGHHTTTFRRNLIAKTGTFSAKRLAEPAPMIFGPDDEFATTTVPLQLTAETKAALSELDASITWRLRSSTIASIAPMTRCPTMQQARNAPSSMTSTSSLGLKHNVKMQLKHWTQANGAYSSQQDLIIALPKSALLIPTTHTEHISRRYSVHISICARGDDVGKATACIEIPLQIGYKDNSEAQAPMYYEFEARTFVFKPQEQASQAAGRSISPPPVYTC